MTTTEKLAEACRNARNILRNDDKVPIFEWAHIAADCVVACNESLAAYETEQAESQLPITESQGRIAVELLLRLRRHGIRKAWEEKEDQCNIWDDLTDLLDAIYGPDFDFHGDTEPTYELAEDPDIEPKREV